MPTVHTPCFGQFRSIRELLRLIPAWLSEGASGNHREKSPVTMSMWKMPTNLYKRHVILTRKCVQVASQPKQGQCVHVTTRLKSENVDERGRRGGEEVGRNIDERKRDDVRLRMHACMHERALTENEDPCEGLVIHCRPVQVIHYARREFHTIDVFEG